MLKKILWGVGGLLLGAVIEYVFIFYPQTAVKNEDLPAFIKSSITQKQVIGFLPFWLLSKAQADYSKYTTTLTYFALTLDTDGTILRKNNPQELEPGWNALNSGLADPFLAKARSNNQKLSLALFTGNNASINSLMENPTVNAQNLINDVKPIMSKYKFKDINLDVESTKIASDEARAHFTQFVKEVKKGMDASQLGTLTLEVTPDALIKKDLINLADVKDYVDNIVLMTYDYHFTGSQVTGPVAPLSGAGVTSEYDTKAALKLALDASPPEKIILGIPLYGYEWETLTETTRSATIPSSGQTASTARIDELITSCTSCKIARDTQADENYLTYKDSQTGTFHQFFYPDAQSTTNKINLVQTQKLGGIGLWALGYEGATILDPIRSWIHH